MGLFGFGKKKRVEEPKKVIPYYEVAPGKGARDTSRDVKLRRDKAANDAIHALLDSGIEDTMGVLMAEEGPNGKRFACYVGADRIGCAEHGETPRIEQLSGKRDKVPCSVALRDYDGKAWSACTVL